MAGAYDEIFEGAVCVFHPAEVFMSFGNGRDQAQARKEFAASGKKLNRTALNENALLSSQCVPRTAYLAPDQAEQRRGQHPATETEHPTTEHLPAETDRAATDRARVGWSGGAAKHWDAPRVAA